MVPPIENQVCKHCGDPAIEGRVELDGRVSYLCQKHVGMNGNPADKGEIGGPPADQKPQDPKPKPLTLAAAAAKPSKHGVRWPSNRATSTGRGNAQTDDGRHPRRGGAALKN